MALPIRPASAGFTAVSLLAGTALGSSARATPAGVSFQYRLGSGSDQILSVEDVFGPPAGSVGGTFNTDSDFIAPAASRRSMM